MANSMSNFVALATIKTQNGECELGLLYDLDSKYRWYETTGEDTEVSGECIEAAIHAAKIAWSGEWKFTITTKVNHVELEENPVEIDPDFENDEYTGPEHQCDGCGKWYREGEHCDHC